MADDEQVSVVLDLVRVRRRLLRVDREEESRTEFEVNSVPGTRTAGGVRTSVSIMKASWRTLEGKNFCSYYKMNQGFETVLDTAKYTEEDAKTLGEGWAHKMNFFYRLASEVKERGTSRYSPNT